MQGFSGKVLHVDLANQKTKVEEMGEKWYGIYAGGGLLGAFWCQ